MIRLARFPLRLLAALAFLSAASVTHAGAASLSLANDGRTSAQLICDGSIVLDSAIISSGAL
jgi:hypothetical protein